MTLEPADHIAELEAYSTTSQEVWRLDARDDVLKLDWNESTVISDVVREKLVDFVGRPGAINWYPDVESIVLSRRLAEFLGCSPMEVLTFGGSDMALRVLCQTFLSRGDTVAVIHPGYDNFRVYAEACGARVESVRPGDRIMDFHAGSFIQSLHELDRLRMIYLINPNNPIGYYVAPETIGRIASEFPNCAVVVDEAYVEFKGFDASTVGLHRERENVVIARSFSKAFGLAGLRLGYLVSHRSNLAQVKKVRNGKNVSMLAQIAGVALLDNVHVVERHVEKVRQARQWFLEKMGGLGVEPHPSSGNFVLIEVSSPQEVIVQLRGHGIYIRDRSYIEGLENMVRISIGYQEQMERVVDIFRSMPADIL